MLNYKIIFFIYIFDFFYNFYFIKKVFLFFINKSINYKIRNIYIIYIKQKLKRNIK